MNMRVNARLSIALPLVLAVFMSFSVGFAQDEEGDTSAALAGVGEIAQTADNFNVSAVPSQEQAQAAVTTPPLVEDSFSPAEIKQHETEMQNGNNRALLAAVGYEHRMHRAHKMRHHMIFRKQTRDILWQFINDPNGGVLTVFTDYSVVATDASGEEILQGYLAISDAGALMIVGEDTDGNQYVVSNGYALGLTVDGDVIMGYGEHMYFYDYDEDGNFVSLTDGDDNQYDVETDEDGSFYITDAYGNTGEFYADGSYDVYDEAGNVFDEGALFGENDDDDEFAFDEGDDDDAGAWGETSDDDSSFGDDDGGS